MHCFSCHRNWLTVHTQIVQFYGKYADNFHSSISDIFPSLSHWLSSARHCGKEYFQSSNGIMAYSFHTTDGNTLEKKLKSHYLLTSLRHWGVRHTPGSCDSWRLEAVRRCPRWHTAAGTVLTENIGWLCHVSKGSRLAGLLPRPTVCFPWGFRRKMLAHPFNWIWCSRARCYWRKSSTGNTEKLSFVSNHILPYTKKYWESVQMYFIEHN